MYRVMNRRGAATVRLPELSGGVNCADAVTAIADHQLSDAENLWFNGGVLRQRPTLQGDAATAVALGRSSVIGRHNIAKRVPIRYSCMVDGDSWSLFAHEIVSAFFLQVSFTMVSAPGRTVALPEILRSRADGESRLAFAAAGQDGIYAYLRVEADGEVRPAVYRLKEEDLRAALAGTTGRAWQLLTDEELHVPLLLDNGLVENSGGSRAQVTGVCPEGRNLLTGRFRMRYSVYNPNRTGGQLMNYGLPCRLPVGSRLTVKVTVGAETYTLSLDITGGIQHSKITDGYGLYYCNEVVGLRHYTGGQIDKQFVDENDYDLHGFNNLEIFGEFGDVSAQADRILGMSFCEWFGGGAQGLSGGTRLFVGGSKTQPNLVHWSELNDPLYFPADNCFSVGNPAEAVTAFARQSDQLILFKERELYSTTYRAGSLSEATVENAMSSTLTSLSAIFPLTQIHGAVGCDCPDSIQLCRNRLVWADSGGRVYTLVAANRYSECNVQELSRSIAPLLEACGAAALRQATSADWQGRYLLLVGDRIFCLDYGDTAFDYITSAGDNERAQRRLVWHPWRLPEEANGGRLTTVADQLCLEQVLFYGDETVEAFSYLYFSRFSRLEPADRVPYLVHADVQANESPVRLTDRPVTAFLQTRLFDLSRPERYKRVCRVWLTLGAEAQPLRVQLLDERGRPSDERLLYLPSPCLDALDASFLQTVQLTPHASRSRRFGLRITGTGGLAVAQLAFQYELLGSVK